MHSLHCYIKRTLRQAWWLQALKTFSTKPCVLANVLIILFGKVYNNLLHCNISLYLKLRVKRHNKTKPTCFPKLRSDTKRDFQRSILFCSLYLIQVLCLKMAYPRKCSNQSIFCCSLRGFHFSALLLCYPHAFPEPLLQIGHQSFSKGKQLCISLDLERVYNVVIS